MKSYSTINILRITYSIILFVFLSNVTILSQAPLHPSLLKKYQSEKSFQNKSPIFKDKKALLEKGIDAPWTAPELAINKSPKANIFQRSFGPARTPSGSWKALVILVQFSDQPTQTNAQTFDELLFGTNFGSMRDYYKKVSYNNLDIITLNLPSSIGWLQVSQPYSYYVDNQNGMGNYPRNSQGLVEEAIRLADPLIDYSKYDNDGDGFVDALFVVHTGTGAEYGGMANQIWSHAWAVPTPILLDGINIYRYSIEPEFWQTPGDMTMGVYAHELGHAAFGLPDVYDRDYTSNGLGDWSLMAGGSWNGTGIGGNYPALPDAWSHTQMGYLYPTVINSNSANLSLPAIETSSTAYILWENGTYLNEYFLIENRQKTGYDQYLPGDGMLVYHVDENVMTQNDYEWFPESLSSNYYLVAIEQADGLWNLEGRGNSNRGDSGDPFPGLTNKRNFNSFTVPDTKDYQSNFTGISIANISNSSSSMTADFNTLNTEPIIALIAPQDGISLESGRKFLIKWSSQNIQNVKLEYTTNNGTSWNLISDNETASNGQYGWIVPFVNSTECKIKITDRSNPNIYASNSNPFIIVEWKKDYLVWEPDPTPLSGLAIKNILEEKGYSVAYSTGLFPEILYPYKGIFICLGVYPNNYQLNEEEAAFFVSYLKQGGNIYMEGAETWSFDPKTSFHTYFNINGIDDGSSDLSSVSGSSGTIMEGLIFNYSGENKFIDRLQPLNNAATIFTNTSVGYNCAILNEGNGYRTIGSSFEFGGLVDQGNLNTKSEIIKRVLEFFNEIPTKPTNLSANLNKSNGLVSLNWNFTRNDYSVYEDFSDGVADNFNLGDNRFSVDEGYLKMNGLSNNSWATTYYNNDFSNFALEYGFKRVQGSPDYSVAAFIRADKAMEAGNENGYLFCVTTSGSFFACKIINGSIMWYRPWSYTSAINTDVGANNIVTIGAMANNLKLIINGNEVFSIIDDLSEPILNGKIFIGAYDPAGTTNEVWWDFFTVDENLASSVMALNLPKADIKEIGGTSLVKSPAINIPQNSVPIISVLDQIKSRELSSELQNFYVYRDDAVIGNTKNNNFDDQLTEFGTYDYKVTALIDNIETEASNIRSVEYKYELSLLHPTSNDLVLANSTYDIVWEGFINDKIKIEYSINNGTDWDTIVSEVPLLDKKYTWNVPNLKSSECKIKITSITNPNYFSVNDGVFVIRALQIVEETEDNGTLALANMVAIGDTISAIIANSNDIDYYKFYGAAGDTVDIYGDGSESGLGGKLRLLFNGNWLEQSQDYQGTNSKQRVSYVLQNTGEYYIRYSYLGNYNEIPANEKQEELDKAENTGINKNSLKEKEITAWDNGAYKIRIEHFKTEKPSYNYVNYYDITFKDLRFSGQIYPNGLETDAVIEYGTTNNYGSEFNIASLNGISRQYFNSAKLTGLEANTIYHYRLKLTNSKGTTYSEDRTFTTSKAPEGWEIVSNNGLYLYDIEFFNKDIGYAAGDGGIYKTIDGGRTWINKYQNHRITGIAIASANKIFGVVDSQLWLSENGGDTWTQTNLGGNLYDISFYNNQIGTICGYEGIWKTTNGGTSWNKVLENNSWIYEVDFVTENIIVATGDNRKVFRTTDGGTSWDETQLSDGYSYIGLDFYGNIGLIVGEGNVIYKTSNAGETWTRLNSSFSNNYHSVEILNENVIYLSAPWESLLIKSIDGGITWKKEEIGTSNGISQLASAEGRILGCGDYGTIIRQTNYLKLGSPNLAVSYLPKSNLKITWGSFGVEKVDLYFSNDNGVSWTNIVKNLDANLGQYGWNLPDAQYEQCKIKIVNSADTEIFDISDEAFRIKAPGKVNETEDNGTLALANFVSIGDTISAIIANRDDIDYYKFYGSAGDTLDIYGNATESGLRGKLVLIFNSTNLYESKSYQWSSSKQRISYIIQKSGEYYLKYSYIDNYNSAPFNTMYEEDERAENTRISKESFKEKEISANDNGAYTIKIEHFKVDKPEYHFLQYKDRTFKDVRFEGQIYPNGLETEVIIEYGTSNNYGNEFNVILLNGVSIQLFTSEKLTGLKASTLYHYRTKLINSKGTTLSDDGIFVTENVPEGWEIVSNNGLYLYDIEFFNKDIGYASGHGGIYKTIDGGKTWVNKFANSWIQGVGIASENKVFGVVGPLLLKSEDGGETWTQTNLGGYLYDITFYDYQKGVVCGDKAIWKTIDGGINWTKIYENDSTIREIKFVTENIIVAVGNNRKVYRTTDGGINWNETQLSDGEYYLGLDFYGNTGFFVGSFNIFYKSDNAGETWTRMYNNLNMYVYYQSVQMLNENVIYFSASGDAPLTKSIDGGNTWQKEEIGTLNAITQLASAEGRIFGCGQYGTIVRQTKMAIVDKLVNLEPGWNMLSVPCQFEDMSFTNLFTHNISNAWQYDNGYKDAQNATVGTGYWMRFSQAQQVHFSGMSADVTKIPVKQGWNMVGFDDRELPVSSVSTDPDGLLSSSFFGYSSGYQTPTILMPGKGYWIKVTSDGDLVIPENLSKAMYVDNANAPTINEKWTKIIVSNSIGESGVLYNVLGENINLERYEMPPTPPSGIFDVRYGTERFAENLTETGTEIKVQSGSYPIRIKPEGMDIKISDGSGKFEKVIRNGEEFLIQSASQSKIYVSMIEIPITYELMQNYPNPFNPSTIIKFGLPESGKVTLSIFNILGEKVADLINKELEAGYHEIKWDASQLSSGLYIYTISTGKFRDVKKMLLMK